jgi:hypothetical protein
MRTPWTEQRKKRLVSLRAAGRSPGEIAEALGLPRQAVVERLRLIDYWTRNRTIIVAGFAKRRQLQRALAQGAIRAMARAVARGMERNQAMLKAHAAGAVWREIGAHFGITAQAARIAALSARSKAGRKPAARGKVRSR